MNTPLPAETLARLFSSARSHAAWLDKPIDAALLRDWYALAKWGPTSMNCLPMRLLFVTSAQAKARLRPALAEGNVEKVAAAPVTTIVAYDTQFYDYLPTLFPHMDNARELYAGDADLCAQTALRNSSLQGAYLIMAARSLGLDIGAMSGFDNAQVDRIFFPDGRWRSNFLINVGYGDHAKLYPRGPRLAFDEACRIE